MAKNIGTLITSPIRPYYDTDVNPTAYANEIKGGLHTVANDTELSNIPVERRQGGMMVTVLNSANNQNKMTTYQSGLTTWNILNLSDTNVSLSDSEYNHSLLNIFPLSFIRDTSKVNIPLKYYYDSTGVTQNKYTITATDNATYITFNRNLPIELFDVNYDSSKKWMVALRESIDAFIIAVSASTNTIYINNKVGTFNIGDNVEFYCWNRNSTALNINFTATGWGGTWDTGYTIKTCSLIYKRKNDNALYGLFRSGQENDYKRIGLFKTYDNFATRTLVASGQTGYDSLSFFSTNDRISILPNPIFLPNGLIAGFLTIQTGSTANIHIHAFICDENLNFKYISTNYFNYYSHTINGISGAFLSPSLEYVDGKYKIVFIHSRGGLTVYGNNKDLYFADFDIENCSYYNEKLILTSDYSPTVDSSVTYLGGYLVQAGFFKYNEELYIMINSLCYNYVNTVISGNNYNGFLYNNNGKWVLDKNGPVMLSPRAETINSVPIGHNTYYANIPAYYVDYSSNKIIFVDILNSNSTNYSFMHSNDLLNNKIKSTFNTDLYVSGSTNLYGNFNIGTGFTYNYTTNVTELKQSGTYPYLLRLVGDFSGNYGVGHIVMMSKTNSNDRMAIGFDSGGTFGYLQAYQNSGSKFDIQLNPLGGTVQLYTANVNDILYFGNTTNFSIAYNSTPNILSISHDSYGDFLQFNAGLYDATFYLTDSNSLKINGNIVYNAGNLNNTSTQFTASRILTNVGTAAAPSYTFGTDTNTGIYRTASDQISISNGGSECFRFTSGGTFHAKDSIIAYSSTLSDIRLKNNIENITNSLNIILQTKGITYDLKVNNKFHYGYIAQDIEKILPNIISEHYIIGDDNIKYKSIRYQEIIPIITEAMKEQQKIIDELKNEIIELKKLK